MGVTVIVWLEMWSNIVCIRNTDIYQQKQKPNQICHIDTIPHRTWSELSLNTWEKNSAFNKKRKKLSSYYYGDIGNQYSQNKTACATISNEIQNKITVYKIIVWSIINVQLSDRAPNLLSRIIQPVQWEACVTQLLVL